MSVFQKTLITDFLCPVTGRKRSKPRSTRLGLSARGNKQVKVEQPGLQRRPLHVIKQNASAPELVVASLPLKAAAMEGKPFGNKSRRVPHSNRGRRVSSCIRIHSSGSSSSDEPLTPPSPSTPTEQIISLPAKKKCRRTGNLKRPNSDDIIVLSSSSEAEKETAPSLPKKLRLSVEKCLVVSEDVQIVHHEPVDQSKFPRWMRVPQYEEECDSSSSDGSLVCVNLSKPPHSIVKKDISEEPPFKKPAILSTSVEMETFPSPPSSPCSHSSPSTVPCFPSSSVHSATPPCIPPLPSPPPSAKLIPSSSPSSLQLASTPLVTTPSSSELPAHASSPVHSPLSQQFEDLTVSDVDLTADSNNYTGPPLAINCCSPPYQSDLDYILSLRGLYSIARQDKVCHASISSHTLTVIPTGQSVPVQQSL